MRQIRRLAVKAFSAWQKDNGGRLGASLAFYTALSLAPLFIFSVNAAGLFLDASRIQAGVLSQVQDLVGPSGVAITETLFDNALDAYQERSGIFATGIGIIILFLAASAVLHELRSALDTIFGSQRDAEPGLARALIKRLISFALVLSLIFLLVVSLLFSTAVAALSGSLSEVALPLGLLRALDIGLNVGLLSLTFALIYKYMPSAALSWRAVWPGALVSALLFTAGKWSIGLWLGNSFLASAYGAAGSLVVFLLWIFFTAQLFFFGAEVIKVYPQVEAEQRLKTATSFDESAT